MSGNRRRKGRSINGLLILDKPQGLTSNGALQRVKRLFGAAKVGHTGSLDPLATGVLPLCFGEATKFSQYLLDANKRYVATIKLGVVTDSGDADGQTLSQHPVEQYSAEQIEQLMTDYRGVISQIPSMFSALKKDGQPLYKLARQGIEVEREARQVTIFKLELLAQREDELDIDVVCSKGTYIRTLAEDMGKQLGCGGHITHLRRLQAGPYEDTQMVTMEQLEHALSEGGHKSIDTLLLPICSAVSQLPAVALAANTAYYLQQGQAVQVSGAPQQGLVCLFQEDQDKASGFLGVGEVLDDGRISPRRLVRA